MRTMILAVAIGLAGIAAAGFAVADDCCQPCGPVCAPKWEDKKTKKPKYAVKCEAECVRGFDAWCDYGCCPEDTPPCAGVFTKKKLMKREEDKVERVLKYEKPADQCFPCPPPGCCNTATCWYDLHALLCRCLGL